MRKPLLFLVFLVGCSFGRSPIFPPVVPSVSQEPDNSIVFVIRTRPVIITGNGQTPWNDHIFNYKMSFVNPVFDQVGIQFHLLDKVMLEAPEFYDVVDGEFKQLCWISKKRAESSGELVIFFVNSLKKSEKRWGGMSNYPSAKDAAERHGIVIAMASPADAVLHELGHSFNLSHPWSDNLKDTPSTGPSDCACTENSCNVMSYCGCSVLLDECLGREFTTEQISVMRKWATIDPRKAVVESVTTRPAPMRPTTQPSN